MEEEEEEERISGKIFHFITYINSAVYSETFAQQKHTKVRRILAPKLHYIESSFSCHEDEKRRRSNPPLLNAF